MKLLTGTTVVADRYGTAHLLREGDPLPEWAVGKVGEHLLTDAADEPSHGGGDGRGDEVLIPPKAGPGSGAPAWTKYADSLGVTVEDGAKRDEIIAALDAAGHPTA